MFMKLAGTSDSKSVMEVTNILDRVFVSIYWMFITNFKGKHVVLFVVIEHVIDRITTSCKHISFQPYFSSYKAIGVFSFYTQLFILSYARGYENEKIKNASF